MSAAIDVDRFLRPRSIAIVGFSTRAGTPSQACLAGLEANGFAGDIHLVGRGGGEFEGRAVLDGVEALPEHVDLALLLLPASGVRAAVAGLIARRARAGVIFASGFAELGDAARREQEAIEQMAAEAGLPLVGPNCMGYTNYVDRLHIGFMPAQPMAPRAGDTRPAIALVTQSGGLMAHFYQALESRHVPIAYRISTGNEVGVQLSDFVAHLANAPSLRVIVCYAEELRDPARFLAAVRAARAAGKFVVLMHSGRTEGARQAAASHTGALAGDWALMAAAVTGAGVLLVDTMDELIDVTELLLRFPPPTKGVAVLTTSGALCAHAVDCCESMGLALPDFSPDVMSALKARMPDFVALGNPFDLTTQVVWDYELIGDCTSLAMSDPVIGSVVVIVPLGNPRMAEGILRRMVALATEARKPLVLCIMGDDSPIPADYLAAVRDAGLPFIRSGERALRAIARITEYGIREASLQTPSSAATTLSAPVAAQKRLPPGAWAEWEAKAFLRDAGIPVPAGSLARTPDEAVRLASEIGWPVALKLQSRQLLHKTEVGGVWLNITDE
ncbi:MAG: acetate--CoA ligase family protein, partial [Novosphingobium sp.]|nr:acetate--CoA ligase family protein [Novosphingobium sp.]